MRKVADKIGYTATTLYNHFEDKDALLRALCDADFGASGVVSRQSERSPTRSSGCASSGQAYIDFACDFRATTGLCS